jgi:hypothetical protein
MTTWSSNQSHHVISFAVHRRKDFVDHIMPSYFRMSKFASFQRQLNLYGFNRFTAGRDKGGMIICRESNVSLLFLPRLILFCISSQVIIMISSWGVNQNYALIFCAERWKEQVHENQQHQNQSLIFIGCRTCRPQTPRNQLLRLVKCHRRAFQVWWTRQPLFCLSIN